MFQHVVCALYKFVTLEDYQALRLPLLKCMEAHQIRGTLILAKEGINGTVAGSRDNIDALLVFLRNDPRLKDLDFKESFSETMPFNRTKVKLKKEIVTMGIEGIDPKQVVGTYVEPSDWNRLLADPELILIDTRNDYEYQVGTFKNAINPKTTNFREFPEFVKQHLDPAKHKKVAMFCTGGIRCEKSSAYLKEQGFSDVFHLKGGILKYLEQVPDQETLWGGECFVFEDRVPVNHSLQQGLHDLCNACRSPITEADKADHRYEQGVSCPHCFGKVTETQKSRFKEREKQMTLARQRGEAHMGADAAKLLEAKRQQKLDRKLKLKVQSV
ncbi:rhodanese-related sulfurtransferase [Methylicorpusculum sp.]|uniref:oxygen-dependent tRNA uridine(34) hydroxylase TrhO n=1 Tax=Methylicorpusculum sp. TaxID=2713644 RepID=UPI002AB955F8|nr:rhodanese-related sulfurtransferase [Methylicorpusculum sp.]MDZ4151551.1 rhodanese-related sulfurtransferase [Methylicorpusculum sp.]